MLNLKLRHSQLPHWAWLIPIYFFTIMMVFTHITTDAYWGDEAVSLRNIGVSPYPVHSFSEVIFHVGVSEWPPAYFGGLAIWGRFVGWSEFATRYLSLLVSLLSIAFLYRLGNQLFNPRTGLMSALLLGSSTYFIYYSHEVRGYSLYVLLTIMCLSLYWTIIHQQRLSRKLIFAFVFSSATLMYTHYLATFIVFAIALYHLLFARKLHNWKSIFFSFILIGIIYLPWIGIALLNVMGVSTWKSGLSIQVIFETVFSAFTNSLWFLAILLMIGSLIISRTRATLMLWFVGIVYMGLSLLAHQLSPFIFNVRHIIAFLPFLILFIAISLDYISHYTQIITVTFIIIWVAAGMWLNRDLSYIQTLPNSSAPTVPIKTFHNTIQIKDQCVQPTDTILTHLMQGKDGWDENTIVYYLASPNDDYNLAMINFMIPLDVTHPEWDLSQPYNTRLRQLTSESERTWVFVAPLAKSVPELQQVSTVLTEQYAYCGQITSNESINVYVFQNNPDITCDSPLISSQTLPACAEPLLPIDE